MCFVACARCARHGDKLPVNESKFVGLLKSRSRSSGDSDEIEPPSQMKDLFDISKQSSFLPRFHSVEGGTNNETWLQGGKQCWLSIQKFMLDASKNVK